MNWLLAQTTLPSSPVPSSPLSGSFWMPEQASTMAPGVDHLFNFIFWITAFFFILIAVLMIIFVIKYRFRKGVREEAEPTVTHSTALELTWTIIPTVLVLMIFYFGFRGFLDMSVSPPNAYEIQVTGQTWVWSFQYPNGHVDPELHIPVDVPVRVVLSSPDVIHSLFIPQFRVKKDAVPGRYNRFWFQATQTTPLGADNKPDPDKAFDIYCAEYCGNGHSTMRAKVFVHDSTDFQRWLAEASDWSKRMTPVQAGEMLYRTRGCTQCHSIDGTRIIGPSLKNVYGEEQKLRDGSSVIADENYIKESIYAPMAKVVATFDPQMPSYQGQLKDKDVDAIIAFLKSISEKGKSESINMSTGAAPTTAPAAATAPITQ